MRTTTLVSAAAAGVSAWVPIDYSLNGFGLAIGCTVTSGGVLTYKAQYTHDDITRYQDCSISRSGTAATVTLNNHGLSGTTDSVFIQGSGDANLDGTYAVASIVNANSFTYTVANSGATASLPGVKCVVMRVFDHPTITGKTANSDGNLAFPVRAVRLNLTAWTSGTATMVLNEGRK
jgi:hypothetical protein